MDLVMLTEKEKEFMTRFAAPSVLTGRFVAAVIGSDRSEIEDAFTDPGDILVHNMDELYADKTYTGYRRIYSIMENPGEIIVTLDKGARENG